ncbi:MAG: prepilin-type N-terminal cleavage/methylation domain-containing protein [Phycisphaeraceae bacterium]
MAGSSRQPRFTLIELLVVISIIALLIAILLPALHRARDSARSIQCLSLLKQLGNANQVYADMYDGFMVPPGNWSAARAWMANPGFTDAMNITAAHGGSSMQANLSWGNAQKTPRQIRLLIWPM